MVVDPMWAGQYLLLDELWRGRERIVFDPQLNQLILAPGGDELAYDKEGRVHRLLESLLAQDSAGVWLLFENLHRVAKAGVDPTLFGARALHDGPLLALRRHWEVAMVDVTRLVDAMSQRPSPLSGDASPLPPEASLVDALLSSLEEDRSLVLWTRADAKEPRDSARLSCLFRLLASTRPGALQNEPQLVGLSRANVLQAFPLGSVPGADEQGVDVDNRLGTDYPDFRYYMAVLGPRIPGGVTLLELPSVEQGPVSSNRPAARRGSDRRSLRDRLDYVEQELEASERSRLELLRDLDHATAQVTELEDELDDLREAPGLISGEEASGEVVSGEASSGPRGVQAQAPAGSSAGDNDEVQEQALLLQASWEIEQLRSALKELRARPVEAIEAENARLRAALESLSSPAAVQQRLVQAEEPDEHAKTSLWNPELRKAQLSQVQSQTQSQSQVVSTAKDWQVELHGIATSLKALRTRIERGETKPLLLQSKLREIERGVEGLLRRGSAKPARVADKILADHVG